MSQVPLYEQASANRPGQPFAPSGLYFLAGHMTNGLFVRNRANGPLKTRQEWQALDAARAPQPTRRPRPEAVLMAALTADVPAPPTLQDVVNHQRRQHGADPMPAPAAPALRTNVGVPRPPTLQDVVNFQRQQGTRPPADVREVQVQRNPNHRHGQCWACHMSESQCYCPTVAPLAPTVMHPSAPRQPEPMLCRHCRRSSCICQIELTDTMARVVARQAELRNLTH